MIKVIIADDEELFREGLAMDVDWQKCGLELVGLAADGYDALEKVKTLQPDIIVTDIRMPYMNGLEFISEVKKINHEIQFIIISGHDEFEYAQKAVKLGVCDFLLKPLEEGELQNVLIERKIQIDKNRLQNKDIDIRNSFLRAGSSNDTYGSELHCIMIVQNDHYSTIEGTPAEYYREIKDDLNTFRHTSLMESRNGSAIICISGDSASSIESNIRQLIRALRNNSVLNQNYSYTIGVSNYSLGINELNNLYYEAKSALREKYLEGKNKTFFYKELRPEDSESVKIEIKDLDYSELMENLRKGDEKLLEISLSKLINSVVNMGKDSFAFGLLVVGNIFTESLKILEEAGVDIDTILRNPMKVYESITSKQTVEEMYEELWINLKQIVDYISHVGSGKNSFLFSRIKAYIEANYSNPDLNLTRLSDNFNISQGYLCSIFSSCFDKTFIEYLTEIRIKKAKKLLINSDLIIYEIAYKIGFNNPSYFNSVFKKNTGQSPGQYRVEHIH